MSTKIYTSSRLKVLRSCLYKHHLRFVLQLRGPETSIMRFGTQCHSALEAWFRSWMALGPTDARLDDALAVVNQIPDLVERAKLRALVVGYDARWGGEPWEILAVEQEFQYELGGYVIAGKVDVIVRDLRDGRVWIVEHKSTSLDTSPGSSYWQRLTLDTQISVYIDGGTVLGHDIAGCIYDVLARPGHERKLATPIEKREYTQGRGCPKCGGSAKPGAVEKGRGYYTVSLVTVEHIPCEGCAATGWKLDKDGKPQMPRLHAKQRESDETEEEYAERIADEIGEDPDRFYRRGIVVRLEDQLPIMRQNLLDTIKVGELCAVVGLAPQNPDACNTFGSMCSYFSICSGAASVDDEIRFPRGDAHPELANAA
jgi:hypothetical protein